METLHIQNLLNNTSLITKKHEELAKTSGENFNIFSIMRMESSEVFTHSALLGELLNPRGSHGKDAAFLNLFLNLLKPIIGQLEFDLEKTNVVIEEHVGLINNDYTEGGYIDIVIKDNKNQILIENKIYAGDQTGQLIRYKNYYPKCSLLYLTLDGKEASEASRGHLVTGEDYHSISYSNFILEWLELCYKESADHPMLRETLRQYINLIKKLTNQSTNTKMKKEIRDLINLDTVEAIELLNSELRSIIYETQIKVLEYINAELSKIAIDLGNGNEIKTGIDPQGGVYIYFQYFVKGIHAGDSDHASILAANLKSIRNTIQSNKWNIGWYYPAPFNGQKFENWDRREILKIYENETAFKSLCVAIIADVTMIASALEFKLKSGENV